MFVKTTHNFIVVLEKSVKEPRVYNRLNFFIRHLIT
jgi:hypothetical protein